MAEQPPAWLAVGGLDPKGHILGLTALVLAAGQVNGWDAALPPLLSRSRAGGGSSGLVPGGSGSARSCRPRAAAARLHGAARDRRRSHGDGAAVSARP